MAKNRRTEVKVPLRLRMEKPSGTDIGESKDVNARGMSYAIEEEPLCSRAAYN